MVTHWLKHFAGMVIISAAITACSSTVPVRQAQLCKTLAWQYHMVQSLKDNNISAIQVGDETTLVLHSDAFFYSNSNHLRAVASKNLDKIIEFINSYPTVSIQVTGFTDSQGEYRRNLALSRAQAQAVVNYFWRHGLNTRLISVCGKGCHQCIASNSTSFGREQNRRIEIYFRLPPPNDLFY